MGDTYIFRDDDGNIKIGGTPSNYENNHGKEKTKREIGEEESFEKLYHHN